VDARKDLYRGRHPTELGSIKRKEKKKRGGRVSRTRDTYQARLGKKKGEEGLHQARPKIQLDRRGSEKDQGAGTKWQERRVIIPLSTTIFGGSRKGVERRVSKIRAQAKSDRRTEKRK